MCDDLIQELLRMDKDSMLVLLIMLHERCGGVIPEEDKKNLSLEYSEYSISLICNNHELSLQGGMKYVELHRDFVFVQRGVSVRGMYYHSLSNEDWLRKQLVIINRVKKINKILCL